MKYAEKRKAIKIHLTETQLEALDIVSRKQGNRSRASLLREAISDLIRKHLPIGREDEDNE